MLTSPDCDSLPASLTDFVRRRFEAVVALPEFLARKAQTRAEPREGTGAAPASLSTRPLTRSMPSSSKPEGTSSVGRSSPGIVLPSAS